MMLLLEGDIIVLLLLAASPILLVILAPGLLVLRSLTVLCNYLDSVVSYVLHHRLPLVLSSISSTFSNLAQGFLMDFTFTEYAVAWLSYYTTVGLPQYGSRYNSPTLGASE